MRGRALVLNFFSQNTASSIDRRAIRRWQMDAPVLFRSSLVAFSKVDKMFGNGMLVEKQPASEATWQSRFFLASQYIGLNEPIDDLKNDETLFEVFDNTSRPQCSGFFDTLEEGFCVPCPGDKPLWWLVLRWLKMMLFKALTSYHAKPLLLIVAPLLVGIFIGYWLGNANRQLKKFNPAVINPSLWNQFCSGLRGWISVICFQFIGRFAEQPPPLVDNRENGILPVDGGKTLKKILSTSKEPVSRDDGTTRLQSQEGEVRKNLRSGAGTYRESGVDVSHVPSHIAVIMDGNRRYGKAKYGSASKGHWDGSSKLVEFAKWCIAEHVSVLTVYAFSTENWNRDPSEVAALMAIFATYCDELRVEALQRNIKIKVLSTDSSRVSWSV